MHDNIILKYIEVQFYNYSDSVISLHYKTHNNSDFMSHNSLLHSHRKDGCMEIIKGFAEFQIRFGHGYNSNTIK